MAGAERRRDGERRIQTTPASLVASLWIQPASAATERAPAVSPILRRTPDTRIVAGHDAAA